MNDHSSEMPDAGPPGSQSAVPQLSADALARRRLLLKGAGSGAAAVAALTPVGALAQGSSTVYTCIGESGQEGLCTLSGVQSAAHSFGPNIIKIPAGGMSPGWWGQVNKKDGTPRRQWPCNYTALFGSVFPSPQSALANVTLFDVVKGSTYSNTNEIHWLCAYLNALASTMNLPDAPNVNCPYTAQEVVDFYAAGNTAALAFFKKYMEKL